MTQRGRTWIPRNAWDKIDVRTVGASEEPPLEVSVVIPARNSQNELDLCLAALASQSYPASALEVVVIDDSSEPALALPETTPPKTSLHRLETLGHGSGAARHLGVNYTTGDILLFIDADVVCDHYHVDAHARWHEAIDDALVLGFRDFVDVPDLGPDEIAFATSSGSLAPLLADRELQAHEWIDRVMDQTNQLLIDREDLWRPVVAASVSIRPQLYHEAGGFPSTPRRGIVDTEFGYRSFTAGAVIIPDRAAYSIHQGQRSFEAHRETIKRARAPIVANRIPSRRFRPASRGRQWAVPYAHVIVDARASYYESTKLTVDGLLGGEFDDLTITIVIDETSCETDLLSDYYHAEGRVTITETLPASGFPSPITIGLPVGLHLRNDSVSELMKHIQQWDHGLISIAVEGNDTPVEVWATRALHRSHRAANSSGGTVREWARRLFGEKWLAGSDVGLS